tara:strand:+ start:5875 stop:6066 length:192 start_codon:yes stop_codon:yes gene_type:complete
MEIDKINLQVDLKVEIGYLLLHMKEAEKSFVETEKAHNSLMKNLSKSINSLTGLLEKLKEEQI